LTNCALAIKITKVAKVKVKYFFIFNSFNDLE
jgi:hypothetical protein